MAAERSKPENRDKVRKALQEQQIPTAVHYPMPLHKQPILANGQTGKTNFLMAEQAAEKVMSLPFHPYLSDSNIEKITQALRAATA